MLLAIGVKESTRFNNVFTVANLVVVVYVIITGSFKGVPFVSVFSDTLFVH